MWLLKNMGGATITFVFLVSAVSFSSSAYMQTRSHRLSPRTATSQTTQHCVCVPYYYCDTKNVVITNGEGFINIRRAGENRMCDSILDVCCTLPEESRLPEKPEHTEADLPFEEPQISSVPNVLEEPEPERPKRPGYFRECGLRRIQRLGNIHRLDRAEAEFGEFPWMVTIFRNPTVQENNKKNETKVYQCQGTLIHERVVLTAAQCVDTGNIRDSFSIRAGQSDTMVTMDEIPYQEIDVSNVIPHRGYQSIKLVNNIALLVLKTPIKTDNNVDIMCLANNMDDIDKNKCLVIGWDKFLGPDDVFTQRSQENIMKKRLEPIIPMDACIKTLQKTILGKNYRLNGKSICAGGPETKRMCSPEIGRPLACPLRNDSNRYVQVGIASWCINSGILETPNIFTNVSRFQEWIDSKMTKLKFDTSVYRAPRRSMVIAQ